MRRTTYQARVAIKNGYQSEERGNPNHRLLLVPQRSAGKLVQHPGRQCAHCLVSQTNDYALPSAIDRTIDNDLLVVERVIPVTNALNLRNVGSL